MSDSYHSSVGKQSACNAGDTGSIPGSGRSPQEGNGSPLQYSCLENPMDRGFWQATVHGVRRVGHDWVTEPPPQYFNCFHYYYICYGYLWSVIFEVTILEHQELQRCKTANLMCVFWLLPWLAVVCLSNLLWPPSFLRHNIEIVS